MTESGTGFATASTRQNGGRVSAPGAECANAAERMVTFGIVISVNFSQGVPAPAQAVQQPTANRASFIGKMVYQQPVNRSVPRACAHMGVCIEYLYRSSIT